MLAGLSKFAKLARSVTRSRSVLVSQFSSHLPNLKDTTKQSHLAHVRSTLDLAPVSPYTYLYRAAWACLLVSLIRSTRQPSSRLSRYLDVVIRRYLILQSQTYTKTLHWNMVEKQPTNQQQICCCFQTKVHIKAQVDDPNKDVKPCF